MSTCWHWSPKRPRITTTASWTANRSPSPPIAAILRHLIRNLLDNATRHGKPPVTITVSHAGAAALIDVCDGGNGIPDDERERVFVPFFRINGDTKGSGLGMTLARGIARLHGGDAS